MLMMKDIKHSFGKKPVLKGFDLQVPKGTTTVIMGYSGCGKSTALRTINKMISPDEGQISWMGKDICTMNNEELTKFRNKVGFVFQRSNLIKRLNVLENVMFPMTMNGYNEADARKKALEALESVDMIQKRGNMVTTLSGGEMQRVAIARAISGDPEIILWDEPTSALDPVLVVEVLKLMESIARNYGTTMVVVTHEIDFALRCSDQIIFMDDGRVVERGKAEDIFDNPQSKIARNYRDLLTYRETGIQINPDNSFIPGILPEMEDVSVDKYVN